MKSNELYCAQVCEQLVTNSFLVDWFWSVMPFDASPTPSHFNGTIENIYKSIDWTLIRNLYWEQIVESICTMSFQRIFGWEYMAASLSIFRCVGVPVPFSKIIYLPNLFVLNPWSNYVFRLNILVSRKGKGGEVRSCRIVQANQKLFLLLFIIHEIQPAIIKQSYHVEG